MSETTNRNNLMVVDLAKNVLVRTAISKANHAALRAGFAGYPPNPRWSTTKYLAWKTGCQWRSALAKGEMEVRSQDSMLVPATKKTSQLEERATNLQRFQLPIWTKGKNASSQTA